MPAMGFCNTMEFPLATFMKSLLQCSVFISYNKQSSSSGIGWGYSDFIYDKSFEFN